MSLRLLTRLISPLIVALVIAPASAQQTQPRDPRPDVPRPASSREAALQSALASDPSVIANWLELARLQEQRGAVGEAEQALRSALAQSGDHSSVIRSLAQFYGRSGQFDKAVATLESAAAQNPNDPLGHQIVATYYWEKAQKDTSLSPEEKLRYLESGIGATDRAIAINPDYIEALTYKNILLRMKANLDSDAARRQALIAEADGLRNRAMELQKTRSGGGAPIGSPPPAPPPAAPGSPDDPASTGMAPVRVGGNIKTPTKLRDVPPVYPPDAHAAGISGLVILEVVIDTSGNVETAKVLRSIPMLDQAATDAVKQWQFTPTHLNGAAVPVIMTVTVNFTIG
jgi:TonB family protein